MTDRIGWNEPLFGEEEKKLVTKVLDSGFVSEGPYTKELEERFQDYLNIKHATLTTSGTAALFLAVKADQIVRGLKSNYKIFIPDLTMIATANAVRLAGVEPVLVDIEKKRFCINPKEIKQKDDFKKEVIIPMHFLGRSCNMTQLKNIAKERELIIIEDAAGCFGSKTLKGYLGTLGEVGCYSLQANKIISCGQGGIVVTNDDEYFDKIKRIKDQGRFSRKEEFYSIEGYNFKFNDILAAVALGQFNNIESRKDRLINQRLEYEKELSNVEQIFFPRVDYKSGEIPLWIDILIENRNELMNYLASKGISTRKCWPPIHRNSPYAYQGDDKDFPNSSFVSDSSLWLPNGSIVTNKDIKYVCERIKDFYKN